MKFLVDAQLPRRLVWQLRAAGHDAIHTLDLPRENRTTDTVINERSIAEQRVVVTKDADFVDSFRIQRRPWKLLLVSTGNIDNQQLDRLILTNSSAIVDGFSQVDFIEITRSRIILYS